MSEQEEDIELVTSLLIEKNVTKETSNCADPVPLSRLPGALCNADITHARRLLYLSHSFAQLSEFTWQFSLTIFLASFSNYRSLLLVSIYGFTSHLAVCLTCPKLGAWMDDMNTNRLWAARLLIGVENISVLMATLCCFVLLSSKKENDDFLKNPTPTSVVMLLLIQIFGCSVRVFDQAFMVAIERDWVVVMSRAFAEVPTLKLDTNHPQLSRIVDHSTKTLSASDAPYTKHLSELNVTMKQIDLTCKIIGPALAGLLLPLASSSTSAETTTGGLEWACLFVGIMNTLALIVEYMCTARIHNLIPSLAYKHQEETRTDEQETPGGDQNDKAAQSDDTLLWYHSFISNELQLYLQQPVALQGLALSLLYCNGLTFGNGILTTYLLFREMNLPTIGVLRGTAAAVGLLGTCVYHVSVRYLSLESTGMWSIVYESVCLGLAYLSVLLQNKSSTVSLVLLITGVCASRIGLWVFDIALTQIQQERVPDGVRARVGGVQQAMNAFCTLVSFAIGFIFPDPADFHIYVATAFFSVTAAMVVYAYGTMANKLEQ